MFRAMLHAHTELFKFFKHSNWIVRAAIIMHFIAYTWFIIDISHQ